MGIPFYFSFIIKNYSRTHNAIIQRHDSTTCIVDDLFMDCNSIIYDSYHEYMKGGNCIILEDDLINLIIKKIEEYVKAIGPRRLLYIAFDGVAPEAKMKQQRERRWKAEIAKGFTTVQGSQSEWSTANITPGTNFMNSLMYAVDDYFLGKSAMYSLNEIIVSGSRDPGEGEHKLFQCIRQRENAMKDARVCIYGLDADLIMLAIFHIQYVGQILICREAPQFMEEGNHLLVLDTGELIRAICSHITDNGKWDMRLANDYAFLCFFLGNDFLPHFPSLNIRTYGIDRLLSVYQNTF